MQKFIYKRIKGSFDEILSSLIYYDCNYYVETVSIKQKTFNNFEAVIKMIKH